MLNRNNLASALIDLLREAGGEELAELKKEHEKLRKLAEGWHAAANSATLVLGATKLSDVPRYAREIVSKVQDLEQQLAAKDEEKAQAVREEREACANVAYNCAHGWQASSMIRSRAMYDRPASEPTREVNGAGDNTEGGATDRGRSRTSEPVPSEGSRHPVPPVGSPAPQPEPAPRRRTRPVTQDTNVHVGSYVVHTEDLPQPEPAPREESCHRCEGTGHLVLYRVHRPHVACGECGGTGRVARELEGQG